MKKRNPIAKELSSSKFKQRIIPFKRWRPPPPEPIAWSLCDECGGDPLDCLRPHCPFNEY